MRVSIALAILACSGLAGCTVTKIQGRIVNCETKKPVSGAHLTVVEAAADPDPNHKHSTLNYYYGSTEKDGTFSVAVASGDPAPWQTKVKKSGFDDTAARYEVGVTKRNFCMKPKP